MEAALQKEVWGKQEIGAWKLERQVESRSRKWFCSRFEGTIFSSSAVAGHIPTARSCCHQLCPPAPTHTPAAGWCAPPWTWILSTKTACSKASLSSSASQTCCVLQPFLRIQWISLGKTHNSQELTPYLAFIWVSSSSTLQPSPSSVLTQFIHVTTRKTTLKHQTKQKTNLSLLPCQDAQAMCRFQCPGSPRLEANGFLLAPPVLPTGPPKPPGETAPSAPS